MAAQNPPAHIAVHLSAWIAGQVKSGQLTPELARVLEGYVGELIDHQGACERIVKTPVDTLGLKDQLQQRLIVESLHIR